VRYACIIYGSMDTLADLSVFITAGGFVLSMWWILFTVAERTWNQESRAWKTVVNGVVAPVAFNAAAFMVLFNITG
jgi:predicted membrane protein